MTDDNKYKNGKIYTIRYKNDDSLIYVGSTVQPLYKRFGAHKSSSKDPKRQHYLLYEKFNETDINDWYIELYEDCPCERKEELNKREGQVIRDVSTLNKRIEGRTVKEYLKEYNEINKNKLKGKKNEYYKENKTKIQEYHKELYKNNKDDINAKHKEYRDDNKDKIKEKHRDYREGNKEKLQEKITCDCGCIVNKFKLARHHKTQKHQQIIKTISI